jgi:thymidylate synthase (FAD)
MKILKESGESTILATWPSQETESSAQCILEKAGRTCYQSERGEVNPESAAKFVSGIMKRGHYSVIEHGWRGYTIRNLATERVILAFWPEAKFMFINWFGKEYVRVSANLETWRKLWSRGALAWFPGIAEDLSRFAPQVFTGDPGHLLEAKHEFADISPITSDVGLSNYELLLHVSHTVRYDNHCRGFTHELVRHRVPVFSQESTRYVDESDFCVVVPPHRDEAEPLSLDYGMHGEMWHGNLREWFGMNEQAYRYLREMGWKPEDARQVLPIATKAQIVMSCNLQERRYIYFRRCHRSAHWEIRRTMCRELEQFKTMYPGLFNDFIYDQQSVSHTVPDCTSMVMRTEGDA